MQLDRYLAWADVQLAYVKPEGPARSSQTISFAGKVFGRTMRFIE